MSRRTQGDTKSGAAPSIPDIVLHGPLAPAIRRRGVLLVPALFDFDAGAEGCPEYPIDQYMPDPADIPSLLDIDGGSGWGLCLWARARIPAAFGFRPLSPRFPWRPELLDFPFLAVLDARAAGPLSIVPFVCVEDGNGPALAFRRAETSWTIKERVADAFWRVVLRGKDELRPFEVCIDSLDQGGDMMKAGYAKGEFFCADLWMETPDEQGCELDPHLAPTADEVFNCPDCGGDGVEDTFPYTEDCGLCGGTGWVAW